MMIGMAGERCNSRRARSDPDNAGKLTSVTTMSKTSDSNNLSASSALATATTVRLGWARSSRVMLRTRSLSSTYRIRSGVADALMRSLRDQRMVNPQHIMQGCASIHDDAASVFLQPVLRAYQYQISRLNDARLVPQQRRRATDLAEGQFAAQELLYLVDQIPHVDNHRLILRYCQLIDDIEHDTFMARQCALREGRRI